MKPLLLIFLILPYLAVSQEYIAFSSEKEGKFYQNSATVFNLEENSEKLKLNLGKSYRGVGQVINLSDTSKLYYLSDIDKNKSVLNVYDVNTYNLLYSLNIDSLSYFSFEPKYFRKSFITVNNDSSRLYLHTIKKRRGILSVYNNQTGELINSVELDKGKGFTELTDDNKYVINYNFSRGNGKIFDATSLQETIQFKLNKSKHLPFYSNHTLFNNTYVKNNKGKSWKVEIFNLLSNKKSRVPGYYTSSVVSYNEHKQNKFYILGQSTEKRRLVAFQYSNGELLKIEVPDVKLKPKLIEGNNDTNELIVFGSRKMALIDFSNPETFVLMDSPFDIADIIWDTNHKRLFLREGKGSEVALFNLETGERLNRSGVGRKGVKFGQFLGSVAIAAVGGNLGYFVYVAKYSNTAMILGKNNESLYVINSKTKDVTHFNAKDLSGRTAIATGKGTMFVYQKEPEDDVMVLSSQQASFINNNEFSVKKLIEYDALLGIDFKNSIIMTEQEGKINAYSMKNGAFIKTLFLSPGSSLIRPKIPADEV